MSKQTIAQNNIFNQPISSHFPELQKISEVLDSDEHSKIIREWLDEDFGWKNNGKGRGSIGSETFLRLGYLMFIRDYSYQELLLAVYDSKSVAAFARIDPGIRLSKSTLHHRISQISSRTWMGLAGIFTQEAIANGLESPSIVRGDSTFVPADVHFPTDWNLMHDVNSCVSRILRNYEELAEKKFNPLPFSEKRSKNLLLEANQTKGEERRKKICAMIEGTHKNIYTYALELQKEVMDFFASQNFENLSLKRAPNITLVRVIEELEHVIEFGQYIVTQAFERVVEGKKLAADEKILSLHDPHVDLLVKGKRDIVIGHKFFLCQGKGGMILSAFSVFGNPSDSNALKLMLEDVIKNTGKIPKQITFDGGFASKSNVKIAKDMGISDVCFSKMCNMKKEEMCSSSRIFNKLRKFRAGVESCFSYLKRKTGLFRVKWKGEAGFNAFVSAAVSTYNALKYAKLILA